MRGESQGITGHNDHHAAVREARRRVRAEALPVRAILIFLGGSALSGLARSIGQLVVFRAIPGLGAGGLMIGATRAT